MYNGDDHDKRETVFDTDRQQEKTRILFCV